MHRRGLSVPDDVALAASGNEYHGDSLPVAITTVDNRYDRVAEALVEQLLERIEHDGRPSEPPRVYTEPELIVREST
ncbi:MAG: substrate-binding domain-containing protein [Planctomycetota bacterium]